MVEVFETRAAAEAATLAVDDLVLVLQDESQDDKTDQLYRVASTTPDTELTLEADLSPSTELGRRVPEADRPTGEEAATGRVAIAVGEGLRQVAWDEIRDDFNAEWGVDGQPGVEAAEADGGSAENTRADANVEALNRALEHAASRGGGVFLPTRRAPSGEIVPYPYRGSIVLPEGGRLIGGRIRIPDGALYSSDYKHNAVRFADGIAYAEIRGIEIDGNASNNDTEYVEGQISSGGARISGLFEGIYFGPASFESGGQVTPPYHVHIADVHVHDVFGSCVVGSGTRVTGHDWVLGNSHTDHLVYFADGETGSPEGVFREDNSVVRGVTGYGFWRGTAFDVTGATITGVVVHSVVANPNVGKVQNLSTIVGCRSYKAPSVITGLRADVDFNLLDSITSVGHGHHLVEGVVRHVGAPDLAAGRNFALVGEQGGLDYYGRHREAHEVRLRVHDAPGGIDFVFVGQNTTRTAPRLQFFVRFHPSATKQQRAVKFQNGVRPLDLDLDTENAPAGGGLIQLISANRAVTTPLVINDVVVRGRFEVDRGLFKDFQSNDPNPNRLGRLVLDAEVTVNSSDLDGAEETMASDRTAVWVRKEDREMATGTHTVQSDASDPKLVFDIPHTLSEPPHEVRVSLDAATAAAYPDIEVFGTTAYETFVRVGMNPRTMVGLADETDLTFDYHFEVHERRTYSRRVLG